MLEGMLNDRVTLVKKDGTVVKENIKAMVQPKTIFMEDVTLPIETGDRLLRSLPSGLVDEYVVSEPGYYSSMSGMKAHFQTKVSRSDNPAAQPSTIINNIQGQNPRVNINSMDYSQNISLSSGASEVFQALRDKIDASEIPSEDARAIREAIKRMEQSNSKEGFKESYKNFIAAAANHVAVFGPILGALSGLL